MGVDSDEPPTGYSFEALSLAGSLEDYFWHIALDTLQVSVRGDWESDGDISPLLTLRDKAIERKAEKKALLVDGPAGIQLRVLPHGALAGYRALLRSADGIEIRGCPSVNGMPPFLVRFGARQCFEWTISEIEHWIRELLAGWQFSMASIHLSEVHLRCDVPEPFTDDDAERMRGLATRNSKIIRHHAIRGGKLHLQTLTNIGGRKPLSVTIYDKRAEQTEKQGVFWPGVWRCFRVPPESPIWRVEFRFKRKRLLARGLNRLNELTPRAVRLLWFYATSEYLSFVVDAGVRTDRTRPIEKWRRITECGESHEPTPIRFYVEVDNSQLFKQAAGTLATLFDRAGISSADEIEQVVQRAIGNGNDRGSEQLLRHIEEAIHTHLGRAEAQLSETLRAPISRMLSAKVAAALDQRPRRRPFSDPGEAGGRS